ncbi:hypothetical protein like AT3G24060 [Hibiscus trionum]|uniref:S-protein homolog n=1 Tax=Hibiscus trionum TaxID=183268 RepID=A0A9W7HH92_HIBTR|nr:hypothetical protein like AT3G24060 [Hibiscus trionum]
MTNLKIIVFPMLLAAISVLPYPWALAASKDTLFKNYHIHITNDLPLFHSPPDKPQFYLHCKSGDRDIGDKAMLKGDDYTFDTKVNLIRSTLFFCNARWVNYKEMTFDAFRAHRDEDRCEEYHNSCLWSVRSDGIYFSNNNVDWANEYPW